MFSVDQIARETGVEANAMDVLALKWRLARVRKTTRSLSRMRMGPVGKKTFAM